MLTAPLPRSLPLPVLPPGARARGRDMAEPTVRGSYFIVDGSGNILEVVDLPVERGRPWRGWVRRVPTHYWYLRGVAFRWLGARPELRIGIEDGWRVELRIALWAWNVLSCAKRPEDFLESRSDPFDLRKTTTYVPVIRWAPSARELMDDVYGLLVRFGAEVEAQMRPNAPAPPAEGVCP